MKKIIKNHKKILIIAIFVVVSLLTIFFIYSRKTEERLLPEKDSYIPKAEDGKEVPPPTDKNNSRETSPMTSDRSSSQGSEQASINISSPKTGNRIQNGTVVQVSAKCLGCTLNYIVKGKQKGVLVDSPTSIFVNTSQSQSFSFEITLEKEPAPGDTGILEVYLMKNSVKTAYFDMGVTF